MDVLFLASCADFLCFTLSLGLQAGGKVLFFRDCFYGDADDGDGFWFGLVGGICRRTRYFCIRTDCRRL